MTPHLPAVRASEGRIVPSVRLHVGQWQIMDEGNSRCTIELRFNAYRSEFPPDPSLCVTPEIRRALLEWLGVQE